MIFREVYVTICSIQYFTKYHSTIINVLCYSFIIKKKGLNNIKVQLATNWKSFASKLTGNAWKTLMEMWKRQILEQMIQCGKVLHSWIRHGYFYLFQLMLFAKFFCDTQIHKGIHLGKLFLKDVREMIYSLKCFREDLWLFWLGEKKQTGRNSIFFFYNICWVW